ncbi:MAG: ferrous iron transport protein B, partial [Clostridia bacterium]|nr:ferrous iron transport protein B [Clostridia bacterium]
DALGCAVVEMSALKGEGSMAAAEKAMEIAKAKKAVELPHVFTGSVEHAVAHIEESIHGKVDESALRWHAIKLFERDEKELETLKLDKDLLDHIETHIVDCENELDDDAESIITNQRYAYISRVVAKAVVKKAAKHALSASDKIDRVVTNRILALPIFAVIMWAVYYISITTVGDWVTGWTNDVLFGEWIVGGLAGWLEGIGCAAWLTGLIADGIVGGVGAVIGFVPQMLILFLMLSILEDVGYMARVAFIMDRIFRKFGLSGKSFIPLLIGTGCSVPGIMASRTIENEADRRMTVITTSFVPCGAKLPVIALIAAALFDDAWWVAPLAYFIGIAAVIVSGVLLKKTKAFQSEPTPFVMELPAYHMPTVGSIARATWDRGWAFIKKAGTIILASTVVIWVLSHLGSVDGCFGFALEMELESSLLGYFGRGTKWLFAPLGFGTIENTVATFMGLVAKEEIVAVLGVLDFLDMTQLAGFSFLLFNLLCAPCFAAMGAIRREMNSAKWTAFAILYQCGFAYAVSFVVYQLGALLAPNTAANPVGVVLAIAVIVGFAYMLLRPAYREANRKKS